MTFCVGEKKNLQVSLEVLLVLFSLSFCSPNAVENEFEFEMRSKMEMTSSSNTKGDALRFWRIQTMKRQKLRYFESKMASSRRERARGRILREWTVSTVRGRESASFLVSGYLVFWIETARKSKAMTSKYEALREWLDRRSLSRLWFHWFLESLNQIEIADKMEIAEQFYHQNLRSLLLRSWRELVVENRRQKKLRRKATDFRRTAVKQRAFGHWHCRFVDGQQHRECDAVALRFQVLDPQTMTMCTHSATHCAATSMSMSIHFEPEHVE